MKNFQYYYTEEAEQFSFYRIPKQLFTDRQYADLSAESKVLYGLLLDRMGLSIKNRWYDEQKRVYIYFTSEEAAQLLGCGRDKAMRLFKELDGRLIHRRKQGCGKPSRIYVGNFAGKNSNQMGKWNEDNIEDCVQEVEKAGFKKSGNPTLIILK